MDIKSVAKKPQLIKLTIDDDAIVTEYGEPLEFWAYDRQPLEEYAKFVTAEQADAVELLEFCSQLILDEKGKPVLVDGVVLPTAVLMACVNKVVEQMGK